MTKFKTLFGDGSAVVVGLPHNFNLSEALSSANEIRLATAFAHMTGWRLMQRDVKACSGKVFLLTGLECNRTEPALLRDWLSLKLNRSEVKVSLASSKAFFHPKVLIVHTSDKQFAIVGSGNLSGGGMQSNCECGVYVTDSSTVAALCIWFDEQFAAGKSLVKPMISEYTPAYKKAKKQIAALDRHQRETEKKIAKIGEASLASRNRALKLAEAYFRDKHFKADYIARKKSAQEMLQYLNPPHFDFDKKAWELFYKKSVLGKLNPLNRDRIFKSQIRLRKALRELLRNSEATIPAVLGKNGKLRIKGFAENAVSKILAAKFPNEWPVYNELVAKVLADFGYTVPRGAGRDGRYLAYRGAMKAFMDACKERGLLHVDAISLDAFFYDRAKVLGF